jgi:hypothetical protein
MASKSQGHLSTLHGYREVEFTVTTQDKMNEARRGEGSDEKKEVGYIKQKVPIERENSEFCRKSARAVTLRRRKGKKGIGKNLLLKLLYIYDYIDIAFTLPNKI